MPKDEEERINWSSHPAMEAMVAAALKEAWRYRTISSENLDGAMMADILRSALLGVEWTPETVEFVAHLKHEKQ